MSRPPVDKVKSNSANHADWRSAQSKRWRMWLLFKGGLNTQEIAEREGLQEPRVCNDLLAVREEMLARGQKISDQQMVGGSKAKAKDTP
jgi:hypothetical protein